MGNGLLQNDAIVLRAPEPEDLELMYRVENAPELWSISNTTVPYSRYMLKQYIASQQNDVYADKQLRLVIERKADKRAVGMIDLIDFNPQHSRAEVGVVLERECREQGIGRQALSLLTEYSFRHLHIHQLYAYIDAENEASRRLFAACGFTECGRLTDWIRIEAGYGETVMVQLIDRCR